jgi:dCTP deaminase
MTVLGNTSIFSAINNGQLNIEPRPSPEPGKPGTPFNTSSVDLHLDPQIRVPKDDLSVIFDLRTGNITKTLASITETLTLDKDGWILKPNRLVLGQTIERVSLPLDGQLAARIEGRSSFARTGLVVHLTAPTIHAGYSGTITLELVNLGPLSLVLAPGMRVCQLIVEKLDCVPVEAQSQFHGQTEPAGKAG